MRSLRFASGLFFGLLAAVSVSQADESSAAQTQVQVEVVEPQDIPILLE